MSATKTVVAKYVFLDIVGFSESRTVEAQTDIIGILNDVVRKAIHDLKIQKDSRILLPTGDGICIALLDITDPYDMHLQLALKIQEHLFQYDASQDDPMRKFQIRIGVNENTDNLVTDVNGNRNVAGAGITLAQRIMDQADGGNIFIGQTVYNHLNQREKYLAKFKRFSVPTKHGRNLEIYLYIDPTIEYINSLEPKSVGNWYHKFLSKVHLK
ncbi:hypothetical protein HYV86_06370 [Candidatus Woesearchaeota archaeon]|nr:hypothetical protein [Candidatus Woesearchaeota archaeon]